MLFKQEEAAPRASHFAQYKGGLQEKKKLSLMLHLQTTHRSTFQQDTTIYKDHL